MSRLQSSRLNALAAHPRLLAHRWQHLIGRSMQTWTEPEFGDWFVAWSNGDKSANAVINQVSTEDLDWLLALVREEQARTIARMKADQPTDPTLASEQGVDFGQSVDDEWEQIKPNPT